MLIPSLIVAATVGGDFCILDPVPPALGTCLYDAQFDAAACEFQAETECNGVWDSICADYAACALIEAANDAYDSYQNCTGTQAECYQAYCDALADATEELCAEMQLCCVSTMSIASIMELPAIDRVRLQMAMAGRR